MSYGLKIPVSFSANTASFEAVEDIRIEIKQNLRLLFLTEPGEKLRDPLYGVGLRRFLFRNKLKTSVDSVVSVIHGQVERYMEFIDIENVVVEEPIDDYNSLKLRFIYSVPSLGIVEEELLFESDGGVL
jgi:uncharacterized protein